MYVPALGNKHDAQHMYNTINYIKHCTYYGVIYFIMVILHSLTTLLRASCLLLQASITLSIMTGLTIY